MTGRSSATNGAEERRLKPEGMSDIGISKSDSCF